MATVASTPFRQRVKRRKSYGLGISNRNNVPVSDENANPDNNLKSSTESFPKKEVYENKAHGEFPHLEGAMEELARVKRCELEIAAEHIAEAEARLNTELAFIEQQLQSEVEMLRTIGERRGRDPADVAKDVSSTEIRFAQAARSKRETSDTLIANLCTFSETVKGDLKLLEKGICEPEFIRDNRECAAGVISAWLQWKVDSISLECALPGDDAESACAFPIELQSRAGPFNISFFGNQQGSQCEGESGKNSDEGTAGDRADRENTGAAVATAGGGGDLLTSLLTLNPRILAAGVRSIAYSYWIWIFGANVQSKKDRKRRNRK